MARAVAWSMAVALIAIAGCTRTESTLVREGTDPQNEDRDVAFRTTYYFRVFDYCVAKQRADNKPVVLPLNDSLYRFRMTGKSSTLFSNIKFESGTLKSWEIDPLGANVAFDEGLRQFRFRSAQELGEEVERQAAYKDFEKLLALYRVKPGNNENDLPAGVKSAIEELLKRRLEDYAGRKLANADRPAPASVSGQATARSQDGSTTTKFDVTSRAEVTTRVPVEVKQLPANDADTAKVEVSAGKPETSIGAPPPAAKAAPPPSLALKCEDNAPARRGFQILGPEGWKTFDQDERLILAMSSSAEPLIGTLKELSARVLNARTSADGLRRPILEEQLKIERADRALDQSTPSDTPEQIVKQAIDKFKEGRAP